MTKFLLTAALTTALGLAALSASAATGSFAGTWTLDKTKSQGLSKRLETADKVTWTIAQDAKTISVDQKVEGGQGFGGPPAGTAGGGQPPGGAPTGTAGGGQPPGGAPAGTAGGGQPPAGAPAGAAGGGMGGMRMPPSVYNLDGTETTVSFDGDRGKGTLKATRMGNAMQLSRKNTFNGPNGVTNSLETRKLELSGDGKVLTATVHNESSRGTTDSTLVFNKE